MRSAVPLIAAHSCAAANCASYSITRPEQVVGLFGQSRFPKALRHQLRLCLPAPSDPRGHRKGGIELEQTRRRLTRLSVTSEMGESGRETAVSSRKGGVLSFGFLPCDDGLIKA